MNNTVTILTEEYEELLRAQKLLEALQAAGVDNWVGYDDALELLDEEF